MRRAASVVFLCAFLASPVLADLQVIYDGASPWLGVDVYSSDGHKGMLVTGQYRIRVTGDTGSIIDAPGAIDAFCIDLDDWAPTGTARTYSVKTLDNAPDYTAGPMGSYRAGYLASLLNTYWDEADWAIAASRTFDYRPTTPYSAAEVAAALQTAVWEIVDEFNTNKYGYDGETIDPASWNVTSGLFMITGNAQVAAIANEMLHNVSHMDPSGFDNYVALSNHACDSYYQDYVVRVPVPAAVLLGILGLGAAGLRLRKRV